MSEVRAFDWRTLRAVAVVFFAVRLGMFAFAHPFMDETYYWLWGQHPALSYFDHPPLIGWTQGAFSALGWNIVGLRLGPVLTLGGDLAMLALLARRLGGAAWQERFWPIAAVFLSAPIFILLTGSALPDHLLVFFVLVTLYAVESLRQALRAGAPHVRFLYLAGLAIGLAMLSKYTGVLLGIGLVITLLAVPELRRLFRSPHLYLAALLALLLQTPVLIWNLQHGFASFGFIVGGRQSLGATFSAVGLWGYVAGAVGVLSPVLCVAMLRFAVPRRDGQGFGRLVFWLSTLGFLAASLFTNILIHWNAVAYVAALPFAVPLLRRRWLMAVQLGYGALALGLAAFNFGVLPLTATVNIADQASAWSYGWDEVATEIRRIEATEHIDFVAASDYALASPLAFAMHDPDVTSLSGRTEEFDYWFAPGAHLGQTALVVADRWRPLNDIAAHFADIAEVGQVHVIRFGRPIGHYQIYLGHGYHP